MSQEMTALDQPGFFSPPPRPNQTSTGSVRFWEIGEYAGLMQQLLSFLDTALKTDQIPFDIRNRGRHQQVVRNPVGVSGYRSLVNFLTQCGQWMDLYWPQYFYSADLQLFFDCFRQHAFARVFGYGTSVAVIHDKAYVAGLYNDFVDFLRTESVHRGVRKRLADWRANLRDQEGAIAYYLGALQTQYRFLLPIRIDLHYAEYAADNRDAMDRKTWAVSEGGIWMPVHSRAAIGHGRPETRARIDAAGAMRDRDRFFENRRGADRALFDRMVGYVCKLEQGGRHRANHFHCIFLFDTTSLARAEVFQMKVRIADRWRSVTRGQGWTYDCHQRPDRAEIQARGEWAIDPIDNADHVEAARFVDYVVRYFTKDDGQIVRVKTAPKARTLTMGR